MPIYHKAQLAVGVTQFCVLPNFPQCFANELGEKHAPCILAEHFAWLFNLP